MIALSLQVAATLAAADTGIATGYLDRYREVMALAPRRDSVAEVSQLVLRRDAAEITLSKGTLYLLSPVAGRTVGAIFRGTGHVSLVPPHAAEQESLRRLLGSPSVDDGISEMILIFSDSMPSQLRSLSFRAPTSDVPGDLRDHVHDLIESLKGDEDGSFDPAVIGALLNEQPGGFFLAHLTRMKGSPLLFKFDPTVVEAVQLYRPASERRTGANWEVVTQFVPTPPLPGPTGMWRFRQRLAVTHYQRETRPAARGCVLGCIPSWSSIPRAGGTAHLHPRSKPRMMVRSGSVARGALLRGIPARCSYSITAI